MPSTSGPSSAGDPGRERGHLGEQVDARSLGQWRVPGAGRREQGPGALDRAGQHALPDVGAGQVDSRDGRTPPEEDRRGTDLRAHAERDEGATGQPQPLGVRGDDLDRGRHRRLDDARGHPGGKLGGEPVPGEQLTPERELESGDRRGAPAHPDRLVGGCVRHRRVTQGHLLTVLDPPHPAGERVGALAGDRHRGVGTDEPGLDQTREVRQVAGAPGGLAGRSRGADRVHAVECRSDHRAAERCRAPPLHPGLAGEREVDLMRRRHMVGPHASEVTPCANRNTVLPSPAHLHTAAQASAAM